MKVFTTRHGLIIEPEGPPDELYLEQVLGAGGTGTVTIRQQAQKGAPNPWGRLLLKAAPPPAPEPEPPTPVAAAPE